MQALKNGYLWNLNFLFRPGSVVPTGLFQGIKSVNPTFRGYSQQVKLSYVFYVTEAVKLSFIF